MKIVLKQNVRVPMPAGTVLQLDDSQAALLISIGYAEEVKADSSAKTAAKKTTKRS